ncbi:V-type ATP synthase subunit F [Candidatus Marsarchaeota archaeon]|jgi:V/A-type H+-transporting ATPase subunit F|nr:V-type ATP synthase subunit F [Candidatus Marsarchaeota archaeon]MCL5089672.1 V-type ATP synthase subunit F [Candidatus Marsarchaeota archaeon]
MKFESIAVIGERELVLGFKLIGISNIFITSGKEAVHLIGTLIESREYGLIFVSESIRKNMDIPMLNRIENTLRPLIVFIPMHGIEKHESVEQLAKRVLGVDIKGLTVNNK